jgi:hypothetical protein
MAHRMQRPCLKLLGLLLLARCGGKSIGGGGQVDAALGGGHGQGTGATSSGGVDASYNSTSAQQHSGGTTLVGSSALGGVPSAMGGSSAIGGSSATGIPSTFDIILAPSDDAGVVVCESVSSCEGGASCAVSSGRPARCRNSTECCTIATSSDNCDGVQCPAGSTCQYYKQQYYRCVFLTCSAQATDKICSLGGGRAGVCCKGECADIDQSNDPSNCGSCGEVCPGTGNTCSGALCWQRCYDCESSGPNACAACPAGYTCDAPGCAVETCAGQADGIVCKAPPNSLGRHYCINGLCVCSPLDSESNCYDLVN